MGDLTAAVAGTRREGLVALRDMLAADLEVCDSMRDKAALSLRLMDTMTQLEALDAAQPATKGTVLDELNQRRALKSQTPRQASTAKRQQRR